MKKYFLTLLFAPLFLLAQIDTKDQPKEDWYKVTRKIHLEKFIKGDSLLKIKPSPVPTGFQDTLRMYDWVDLGGYNYYEKKFSIWYDTEPLQYNFWRLDEGDTMVEFICNRDIKKIQHTNFKVTYGNFPTYTFKKSAGNYFIELCTYVTSKEYLKVISYKNGLLIIDIPMNGKMTDKKMHYRKIYLARQKTFNWNKNNQ